MRWEIIRVQKHSKDGLPLSRSIGEVAHAKNRDEAIARYALAAGLTTGGDRVEYYAKCTIGKERAA